VTCEQWKAKPERNIARDSDTAARLHGTWWEVIVVWEHEDPKSPQPESSPWTPAPGHVNPHHIPTRCSGRHV
jgi:hypothetical protein